MNPLLTTGLSGASRMTALSVNVNLVAQIRNRRDNGIPSVTAMSRLALEAGAHGITVHPRPDERHIRAHDVSDLAALLQDWPQAEFNIEGNPFHNLMGFIRRFKPHQCTLVPDSEGQATSDHGWRFPDDAERLAPVIAEARALGVRVSLFMDPLPGMMAAARDLGADRIELYTESYARAFRTPRQAEVTQAFVDAARAAQQAGLELNAGHDLNRANLGDFLAAVPVVREVSIGHALIADTLELGMTETVHQYLHSIQRAFAAP